MTVSNFKAIAKVLHPNSFHLEISKCSSVWLIACGNQNWNKVSRIEKKGKFYESIQRKANENKLRGTTMTLHL